MVQKQNKKSSKDPFNEAYFSSESNNSWIRPRYVVYNPYKDMELKEKNFNWIKTKFSFPHKAVSIHAVTCVLKEIYGSTWIKGKQNNKTMKLEDEMVLEWNIDTRFKKEMTWIK